MEGDSGRDRLKMTVEISHDPLAIESIRHELQADPVWLKSGAKFNRQLEAVTPRHHCGEPQRRDQAALTRRVRRFDRTGDMGIVQRHQAAGMIEPGAGLGQPRV
jgi:hypothetical protein